MNQFPDPHSQYPHGLQPQPPTAPPAHGFSNTSYPMTTIEYSPPTQYPAYPNMPISMAYLNAPNTMSMSQPTVPHCNPTQYPNAPNPVSMPQPTAPHCNPTQYPNAPNPVSMPQPTAPHCNPTQYPNAPNPISMPQPTAPHCNPTQYPNAPIPVSMPHPTLQAAPHCNPTQYPNALNLVNIPQPTMSHCHSTQYPHTSNQVSVPQPTPAHFQPLPNMPVSLPIKTPWKPTMKKKYRGKDIPSKDVSENDAEAKLPHTSPLPYKAEIPGYENVSHSHGSLIKPPVLNDNPGAPSPAIIDVQRTHNITDEDARRALLELVQANCCWGSKAAKKMDIKDVVGTSAYHYIMESFTEGRRASIAFKPFKGGTIDSPHCGVSTLPWDIRCNPKAIFQSETGEIQVPHTEMVTECHRCDSRGFNRCTKCRGRGTLRCGPCNGSKIKIVKDEEGNEKEIECHSCHGKGQKTCSKCSGIGCIVCTACKGYGTITQYIEVSVIYSHRRDDHIVERTDLPDHLIRNVNGDVIFEQTSKLVSPIDAFFESEINSASKRLVQSHNTSWPAERMLKQKHKLRSVAVHECHFVYKSKPGRFWVYGNQKEVYTCDYPHTCCCCRCCCTIL